MVEGMGASTLTPASLRDAAHINLGRHPDTAQARAFVLALTEMVRPLLHRARPLGDKGMTTLKEDVGLIMGGIMRPGLQGLPVRAQKSPSGTMWKGSPIGRDRFWSIIGAIERAGMVETLAGGATPRNSWGEWGGNATALWIKKALEEMAATHGVNQDTRKADWRADPRMRSKARLVREADIVTCEGDDQGREAVLSSAMAAEMCQLRAALRRINEANGAADIRGAGHTSTMVRRFRHSLGFGGRFYSPVSQMAPEDRRRITIGGKAVAEVDVKASQLTLLMGLQGQRTAPRDAYEAASIPRDVLKAWMMQCLGSGRPFTRWSPNGAGATSGIKPAEVWNAIKARYSFLADLPSMVPPDLLETIPIGKQHKAAGQWIVQKEAAIMGAAMSVLAYAGVPVLSVHDSLIVPWDAEEAAKTALTDAFVSQAGITPRLTVQKAT